MLSAFPAIAGRTPDAGRARAARRARRRVPRRAYRALVWRDAGLRRLLPRVHAGRRARAARRSARARRAGPTAATTSARCARSRGSSPGRRTGRCCRPGTAAAPPSPPPTSTELRAPLPRAAVLPLARRQPRDDAREVEPRGRARVPRARPGRARARSASSARSPPSTSARVAAVLAIVGEERLLERQPGRPPLDRHPQPVRRPDERDPGRAAAPLPRRRRERAAAADAARSPGSRRRCATRE